MKLLELITNTKHLWYIKCPLPSKRFPYIETLYHALMLTLIVSFLHNLDYQVLVSTTGNQ